MSACICSIVLPTTSYGELVTSFVGCGAAGGSSLTTPVQTFGSKPGTPAAIVARLQLTSVHSSAVLRSASGGAALSDVATLRTASTSVPAAGRALSAAEPVPCRSPVPMATKRASDLVSPAASWNRCT